MEVFDTYFGGALIVFVSCAMAVGGLLLSRRFLDIQRLKASHEVGGYLLSVAGTMYAVLLGLVVVDSMQKFQQTRDVTEREANCLADVFMLANCLPDDRREKIRQQCIAYADQVLNVEWKDLDKGSECPIARHLAVGLMESLVDFEPQSENQKALYPILVSEATQVWQCRRTRTNAATHGIPTAEWITLLVGGAVTIFFTYLFGLETTRLQIVMTIMVTTLISLNILLIMFFAYPFTGDVSISDMPFRIDKAIFEHRLRQFR